MFRLFLLLWMTVPLYAFPSGLRVDKEAVFRITGPIDVTTAKRAFDFFSTAPENIVVLIDSPGGDLAVGEYIYTLIKQKQVMGGGVLCLANGWVYSAAFLVYTACNTRSALPTAKFLWHSVSVYVGGAQINQQAAEHLAFRLREVNEWYERLVRMVLVVPNEYYQQCFLQEHEIPRDELYRVTQGTFFTNLDNLVIYEGTKPVEILPKKKDE